MSTPPPPQRHRTETLDTSTRTTETVQKTSSQEHTVSTYLASATWIANTDVCSAVLGPFDSVADLAAAMKKHDRKFGGPYSAEYSRRFPAVDDCGFCFPGYSRYELRTTIRITSCDESDAASQTTTTTQSNYTLVSCSKHRLRGAEAAFTLMKGETTAEDQSGCDSDRENDDESDGDDDGDLGDQETSGKS